MGITPIVESMVAVVSRASKKLKRNFLVRSSTDDDDYKNSTTKNTIALAITPVLTPARMFIKKTSRRIRFLSKNLISSRGITSDKEVVKAIWKRTILMGEKCQPLDFAGVIYYDDKGKRLDGVPAKSPRHPMGELASQLPSFRSPASTVDVPVPVSVLHTSGAW